MNIVFILGNGFDLNIKMETSYSSFYKYYGDIVSKDKSIIDLKKNIKSNIENWADLESEFGKYTQHVESLNEIKKIYNSIQDALGDYLKSVEENYDYSQLNLDKIYKHLAFPESTLFPLDARRVKDYRRKWSSVAWSVQIITLNYTNSLEKILKYNNQPIQIQKHLGRNSPVTIHKVEHLHGFHNERMVMGVSDDSQIYNTNFARTDEIRQTLIKSECNRAQRHGIDVWCMDQISRANLICVFGSSIGSTDTYLWEHLGNQLKNGCLIIIFYHNAKIKVSRRRPQDAIVLEEIVKKDFLSKSKLTKTELENLQANVIVSINNKEMFQLL